MPTQRRQASIMGSSFCPGASNWLPRLKPGQQLRAEREPENQYDVNAVALYTFQQKLGYVPRGLAAEIAPFMDTGHTVAVSKSRDPKFGGAGVIVVEWTTPDEEPWS